MNPYTEGVILFHLRAIAKRCYLYLEPHPGLEPRYRGDGPKSSPAHRAAMAKWHQEYYGLKQQKRR